MICSSIIGGEIDGCGFQLEVANKVEEELWVVRGGRDKMVFFSLIGCR
jgi:hypothetical protein